MSLTGTYRLRNKTKEKKPEKKPEQTSDNTLAELEKIAISPELAAEWSEDGCGKPC